MLWLATPTLCAAVSNAGGLGNITACNYNSGEELREAIHKTRALTVCPFSVNITLMPSMRITDEILADFFKVCAQEKVPALEVSGRPAREYLGMMKKAGVFTMHKVGSVRHALNIEKAGYDAVIAAGVEEGGHPLNDDVTSMVLWPRIAESVNVPVLACGGIADGRGLAAALVLGCEAAFMATRFIATKECAVHPDIWNLLLAAKEQDTVLFGNSTGLQGRALKNRLIEEILKKEAAGAGAREIIAMLPGVKAKEAWRTGKTDEAALMIGQSAGLIKDIPSCQELIENMMAEARSVLHKNWERVKE
jgi:nitronate monooxygenase